MELIKVELSAENYDKAVHGGLDDLPVLAEYGDLAFYVKPEATREGKPMVVVTFTVDLPDGNKARAQATVTLTNIINVFSILRGWKDGGHLGPNKN